MKCKIIKEDEYITTKWSGGSTSQIAIAPEDAVFSRMEFQWRISRATVEAQESVFTPMPGFHRVLYLLSGGTMLHMQEKELRIWPGSQVSFPGDWQVSSRGQGTDLNLIMAPETGGWIERRVLAAGSQAFPIPSDAEECLLYLEGGELWMEQKKAVRGDSILCCPDERRHIMLEVEEPAEVICFFIARRIV